MNISTFRRIVLPVIDCILMLAACMITAVLTIGIHAPLRSLLLPFLLLTGVKLVVLQLTGLYDLSVRHCSLDLMGRALWSVACDIASMCIVCSRNGWESISLRFYCNLAVWNYLALVVWRVVVRMGAEMYTHRKVGNRPRAIIYGAGDCGRAFARFSEEGNLAYAVMGFIDDDPAKDHKVILGKKVYGPLEKLDAVMGLTESTYIIIAISNGISAEQTQSVALVAKKHHAQVLIAPSIYEMLGRRKKELDLRSLDYADLLGRPLITIQREPVEKMLKGKRVLVTGAGGSIGSEICHQIRSFSPSQLLLLDIDETELHRIALELTDYQKEFSTEVFPVCCDIKNREKLAHVFDVFRPQIVFHAAAYKHVPMMEMYPEEAIRTNILGSYNLLSAAKKYHAEKVIVISTDKAVNPTNVMGATKRVVELEAAMLTSQETPIVAVRFGNVLGSRGSMLPLFFDQIKNGVPITVTDKKIIRYFMAIPEAVGLVFRAGAMAKSGEVMVLDMGEPVKIYDFAQKLIEIYGNPEKNKIVITGLRPGEKLYEELLANKDNTIPTDDRRIFKAKVNGSLRQEQFDQIVLHIAQDNPQELIQILSEIVPEFTHKETRSWESYALRNEDRE